MVDLPAIITTATICAYWFGVGVMIVRVKRHSRAIPILSPKLPLERAMGVVFVPMVALWILAIGTHLTALTRIVHVWRTSEAAAKAEVTG